ncbi:copper chaperone PCu(A)C [Streptomyces sp. 7R007]
MSSSLRRGALGAAAIAFSIASLAACGAGSDAQTLQIKPDNAAVTVGDIKLQNVTIITQPDLESTGPAVISATVFNNGDTAQTLDAITVPGTGKSAEITPAKGTGKLSVPAHGSVVIGGKGNAAAVLSSSREAVQDGNAQKVTFTFSKSGDVSLRAFVVPAKSYFSKWGPSDIPSPTASASAKPGKSTSPSASPSESATTSATPTDSASASATAQ